MKNLIFGIALFVCPVINAQFIRGPIPIQNGVLDGIYIAENIPTKKVVPYNYIREADVMWSKRVWSVIDLREKFNQPLYYPNDNIQNGVWNRNNSVWSLWTIMRDHILRGDLTLYSPFNPMWEAWTDGDSFKYPIKSTYKGGNYYNDSIFREQVFLYLGTEIVDPFAVPLKSWLDPTEDSVITHPDRSMSLVYPSNDTSWIMSQDIIEFRLKEDWFFDKERSVLEKRIIGIAPVIHQKDINGNITGQRELFWLYFPECRYVFQNYYVANRHNSSQLMSLDDLFMKRMFHSYLLKESNVSQREIGDYQAGINALIESNSIKEQVNNFEHDLWAY